jgi:CBS domain-containing protein
MSRDVEIASPEDSIQKVARRMAEMDTGCLPVGEKDQLVGMVTDRDLAVRAVAAGKDPKSTKVREVMTETIKYCFEDEDLDHVAENMAEEQIRRLPVMSREKRLVGIVALGDIATEHHSGKAGEALRGISQSAHH